MKRISFLLLSIIALTVQAQHLANYYQATEIKLMSDANYARNNNWDKLFPDCAEKAGDRTTGINKKIVIAPDGSVFMSHRTRHSISKFDSNGNFEKEFGKKGGKNPADFIYMPTVEGILDDKYLYTTAVDGRMHFFDMNGKWVKTFKLKYMPLGTTPLKGGRIAIMGHVPCGNGSKHIVSLLNVATGKEKVISSTFQLYSDNDKRRIVINPYFYKDKDGKEQRIGNWISMSLPLNDPMTDRPRMGTTTTGNLVIAYPLTGEVAILDPNGNKIKQFKTDLKPDVITKEDREGYYQDALKNLSKMEQAVANKTNNKEYFEHYVAQYRQQIEKFRDPANYPANLPYFSEMLVDSENNILLFRFTREEGSNKFDAFTFSKEGRRIGTSTFVTDGYDLKINPSIFQFYNGKIYTWIKQTDAKTDCSMRLVRFDLKK